ncbi:MAG: hypothetical protein F4Y45_01765 [Acidobacteria bacterium]|nr:hypothetical protein [Acidobacteriota bacterium]MYJ04286.1 hypothetical protein [Acidobacteriota bacterium]
MAEDDVRRFGEIVEVAQGAIKLALLEPGADEGPAVGIDGCQRVDSLVSLADLQVEGQIAHQNSRGDSLPEPHIRYRLHEHRFDYPR